MDDVQHELMKTKSYKMYVQEMERIKMPKLMILPYKRWLRIAV